MTEWLFLKLFPSRNISWPTRRISNDAEAWRPHFFLPTKRGSQVESGVEFCPPGRITLVPKSSGSAQPIRISAPTFRWVLTFIAQRQPCIRNCVIAKSCFRVNAPPLPFVLPSCDDARFIPELIIPTFEFFKTTKIETKILSLLPVSSRSYYAYLHF